MSMTKDEFAARFGGHKLGQLREICANDGLLLSAKSRDEAITEMYEHTIGKRLMAPLTGAKETEPAPSAGLSYEARISANLRAQGGTSVNTPSGRFGLKWAPITAEQHVELSKRPKIVEVRIKS